MLENMEDITFEESQKISNPLYVDVRAPVEYNEDHIPGAVNLPIFNDEERKEVGTLYKMAGKMDAVKRGSEIGGKRIPEIIKSLAEVKDREIIIYCARGGMRSGAVASLINSLGIKTYRIIDGYRSYRNLVMDYLSTVRIRPQVFVLQGLTGAGKTEVLKTIGNSVDLEEMAGHRSSLFGSIGLKQNSQKRFETLLWQRLVELNDEDFVLFEGESKKIGNLHIPDNIFSQMREAPAVFLDTPVDKRVEIIRKEYTGFNEDELVLKTVNTLRKKLGGVKTDTLIELYTSGNVDEFIKILLLDYYDQLYRHTLDTFEYLAHINYTDTAGTSDALLGVIEKFLSVQRRR